MAISALQNKKALDEKRVALRKLEETSFEKREAELAVLTENATDETRSEVECAVEALETEKADTAKKIEDLRAEIEALEKELAESEESEPSKEQNPQERALKAMENIEVRNSAEYINAYADYIKSGDATRCKEMMVRTDPTHVLTENANGGVAVPAMVEEIVRHAWDNEGIMALVKKSYIKGNLKVGFEISADGAVVHTEGASAPTEENLSLGIVTLVPKSIKKWISVSDEAADLRGEAFLRYIYEELTHQIAKKAADELIAAIASCTTTGSTTSPIVPSVTESTVGVGTVAKAMAQLSDEASNPVVMMNKATWADFKAAQYANKFSVDPFEGLQVVFNNTITAYSAATTGVTYAIVGDLGQGALANFPNGEEINIKVDEMSLAEQDLIKFVGREFVGIGIVAPKAFCKITK